MMAEGKEQCWTHPGKETRDSEYILRTHTSGIGWREKITITVSS